VRSQASAFVVIVALSFAFWASGCAPTSDRVKVNVALPVEELHLPNGLHVVLHREASASAALVYLRYHVGSKDDPQGRSGFAHLYEHLMFRGSRNTGAKAYEQWLEDDGGTFNASTSADHTDYHATVPPSALPRAIWLEADRMAYPLAALDEEVFQRERDVVKNEWREHYEDVPLGNLDSIAREAIYGADHPYGTPTIGRGDELDKATLAEARAFARLYYRPNNATLVVCGLVDVAATRALVVRYFGTIPPGPTLVSRFIPPPSPPREQKIDVAAAVEGPAVAVAWPAPATHGDGSDELAYGFRWFASRVRWRLVTDMKVANEVDTRYDHGRLGGHVMITVKLKRSSSASSALGVIDHYLAESSRLGRTFTWDNFGDFKTRALVAEIGDLEGLDGRARRVLHDLELHGAPNSVQVDLRSLQSVEAADVGEAVDHFLVDGPRVTIAVTPDANAPRAGRRVGR
jgi:zinc protease